MYQPDSLLVYLGFLALIFVIIMLIVAVTAARARKRQQQEHAPGTIVGTGGKPLLDRGNPEYRERVVEQDEDVGGNVRDIPNVPQHDNAHQSR